MRLGVETLRHGLDDVFDGGLIPRGCQADDPLIGQGIDQRQGKPRLAAIVGCT